MKHIIYSIALVSTLIPLQILADDYPLHTAAKNNNIAMTLQLLEDGCDPNQQDEQGNTALHYAIEKTNTKIAFLLIAAGTKSTIKNNKEQTTIDCINYQIPDLNHATFVHNAALLYLIEEVLTILEYGVNLHIEDGYGRTLLHRSADIHNFGLLKKLLKLGSNSNHLDKHHENPLHIASRSNHLNIVEELLLADACCLISNISGSTPKDLAKSPEMIQLFDTIENGIKKFIKNPIDFEPIEFYLTNVSKGFVSIEELSSEFFLKQLYYGMYEEDYKNSLIDIGEKFIHRDKKHQFDALIENCNFDKDDSKKHYYKLKSMQYILAKRQQQYALFKLTSTQKKIFDTQFRFK